MIGAKKNLRVLLQLSDPPMAVKSIFAASTLPGYIKPVMINIKRKNLKNTNKLKPKIMNKATKEQLKKDIMGSYVFLRENNYTIPDQSLDFIKNAALEKLGNQNIKQALLSTVIVLQGRLEILINLTPTDTVRNKFTRENIKVLELVNKIKKQQNV